MVLHFKWIPPQCFWILNPLTLWIHTKLCCSTVYGKLFATVTKCFHKLINLWQHCAFHKNKHLLSVELYQFTAHFPLLKLHIKNHLTRNMSQVDIVLLWSRLVTGNAMCSMSLALTAVIHQKCVCRAKQRSFSASVDSGSVWNMSGSSFAQSVGVMKRGGELFMMTKTCWCSLPARLQRHPSINISYRHWVWIENTAEIHSPLCRCHAEQKLLFCNSRKKCKCEKSPYLSTPSLSDINHRATARPALTIAPDTHKSISFQSTCHLTSSRQRYATLKL